MFSNRFSDCHVSMGKPTVPIIHTIEEAELLLEQLSHLGFQFVAAHVADCHFAVLAD